MFFQIFSCEMCFDNQILLESEEKELKKPPVHQKNTSTGLEVYKNFFEPKIYL